MRRESYAAGLVALALTGGALTGCSSPNPSSDGGGSRHTAGSEGAPRQPLQLSARIVQARRYEGTRQIGVRVTNKESRPLRIRVERLEWPAARAGESSVGARFSPRQRIDLPVTLHPFRCAGGSPSAAPVAYLRVTSESHAQVVRVSATGAALLDRLRTATCQRRALARVMDIDYAPRWVAVRDPEPGMRGSVLFNRRAPGRLRVVGLSGSVLLDIRSDSTVRPPLDMPPDQPHARLPVTVTAFRCDAHALAGSTQTFLLSLFVRLDSEPVQRVILVPPRKVQGRLLAMVSRSCMP